MDEQHNNELQESGADAVQEAPEEGIDPIKAAIAGDIFPLVASLKHYPFTTLVDTFTPLAHYLCTLYVPLDSLLDGRTLPMDKNIQGRTPLSFAIKTKDPLATLYCLQQDQELNPRSVYGLTPAMQAVKGGFRIGFLLCLHFGHLTDDLANVAAQVNDIWTLKVLKSVGSPLNEADFKGITPLQSACISYLGRLFPKEIKMQKLGKLVKSKTIINNLKEIKYKSPPNNWLQSSFLTETSFLVILFLLINNFPKFSDILYLNYILLLSLCSIILYHNAPQVPPKSQKNILELVQPFLESQLPQVCPVCVQIKKSSDDHCIKCGVCVEGFHFHEAVCTSKCNQVRWAVKQVLWLIILKSIVGTYIQIAEPTFTTPWYYLQTFSILYAESSYLLNDFFLYSVCLVYYLKQVLVCFLLFYMIVTGLTYQQVFDSGRFPHLYKPVLIEGQYYNQPINAQQGSLKARARRGISNIARFFCG